MLPLVAFALPYLIGSLVMGVLYSHLRGDDIRSRDLPGGSGTYRQYGRGAAILVSALDIFKGAGAVWLSDLLVPGLGWLATFGVVLGHCYPVFFGFRGGGGIAPFLGAMLVAAPLTIGLTVALALALIPVYKATLQPHVRLNAIPFVTAVALPVGLLLANRFGGFSAFLAGSLAMLVRSVHLLTEKKPGTV